VKCLSGGFLNLREFYFATISQCNPFRHRRKSLAYQQCKKVRWHSVLWHKKHQTSNLYAQRNHGDGKGLIHFSKSIQNTAKGRRNVHKRTQPGKNADILSGLWLMEYGVAEKISGKQEKGGAGKTKTAAKGEGKPDNLVEIVSVLLLVCSGDYRKQKHGQGAGKGSRKENKRKCHAV